MPMNVVAEHPGVSTVAGTPREVRDLLSRSRAERVLVLSFDHVEPQVLRTLSDNVGQVATSMFGALQDQQDPIWMEKLAETLVPRAPASPRLMREAAMVDRTRKAVLQSGDWLTAAQIAELAGLSSRNPSAQPNKWKKKGQIFAIRHAGVDYFPGYGLDADAGFRPLKSLARVIEVLAEHKDGWGMAYWFRAIHTSCSAGSTPCRRGSPPMEGADAG
jgi:hypothetical protein